MVHKSSSLAGGGGGSGSVSDITSTGGTIAIANPTGPTTNIEVANNTVNTLAGYNNFGAFSDVTIGTNLTLSGGVLNASGGGAVSSVFGRSGAVSTNYGDYNFNLISGAASVSQGGTGQISLIANSVLLGEGAVTGVGFATTGIAGRLLIDIGVGVNPTFLPMSGDAVIASTGAITLATVNANTGSFGSSTSIPTFNINNKGLITSASGNVVIAPASTLTGTTLASNITASSLSTLGILVGLSSTGFITTVDSPGASSSAISGTGSIFTGGTGTTTFPYFLLQPANAVAFTAWSTAGTFEGVNSASGFAGNFQHFSNNNSSVYRIDSAGGIHSAAGATIGGQLISSQAGALSAPAVSFTGAPITGGSGTSTAPYLLFQPSAATTSVSNWSTSGTFIGINSANGFAGNFLSFYNNAGNPEFSVGSNGNASSAGGFTSTATTTSFSAPATGRYLWASRSGMFAPADGIIEFTNNASTGFTRLQLGGTTSSFPSLKVNGSNLNFRLADDSADTGITSSTLGQSGKTITYNNISTVGWGHPAIYGNGRSVANVAAVSSVAAYTNGATDGSFMISANVLVTASVTHNFTTICTYTDEGNTQRTLTLNFSQLTGTFLTAITNVQGAGAYEGIPLHIRCLASTPITIATTGTFTSVTYNVEGYITQIG